MPEVLMTLSEQQRVNHAFVNSLSSVRSLTELLVDFPGLESGDRTRFLAIIREETDRLVTLLAEIEAVSRQT